MLYHNNNQKKKKIPSNKMPIIFFVRCKSRMSERDVIFPESLVRERNTGEKEGREGRKPADQFLDTA